MEEDDDDDNDDDDVKSLLCFTVIRMPILIEEKHTHTHTHTHIYIYIYIYIYNKALLQFALSAFDFMFL